jgi:hypothetical protein
MRKVPVLAVLMVICALVSAPVYAGTAMANDPPSVSLAPGQNAPDAFMLADFFADPTGAQVDAGGSVGANGLVTIDGAAASAAGHTQISAGGESGSGDLLVSANKFANRPAIDNNNRLVGVAGGNAFVNLIPAGQSVTSAMPLGNPGGSGTGGGALTTAIGEVSLSSDGVWRKRSSGPATGTGITASVDASGNYTISAAAGASASIVSIVSAGADVVQVLAAPATSVGAPIVGTHTVAANGGVAFLVGTEAIAVADEYVQLSITYNASSVNGVAIAPVGFDGGVVGNNMNYTNPSGGQLQAGVAKNLATSVKSLSGSVTPAVQIFNGGTAAVTVNITRCVVGQARNLVDYAINPNSILASHNLDSIDGLIADIAAQGAAGPTDEGDVIGLAAPGANDIANASIIDGQAVGTVVAEVFVQKVGAGSGTFVLNVTDGAGVSYAMFVPGDSIPTTGWLKVQATGTVSTGAGPLIATMQAAGGLSVLCDDLSLRNIQQADNQYDANLIGG